MNTMTLKALSDFMNQSGLRKVTTGLILYAVNAFLLFNKMLADASFTELSQWLILALFAGNAFEHYVKKMSPPENAAPAPKETP